ncbi:MAG: segregation/condensation protein A [candidate division WOR-3 bacterium]|uniref:Segregation and condensation protein A n=1 Tax=candidate division WOR-3 bacterium TaxID=2052148 RepID=A0A7C3IX86_UNCW3|nr:segregation/condensation protein A [candidate division WOR-3 bacterium]
MSEVAQVRLDIFEGPVELLLYLVRKNELDILDIPIARLTDDYLAMLRNSTALNLEVAGDFLTMAAVLVRLKVRALLPRTEEEDLSTPQVSLEQILDAYRQFQSAARLLARREAEQRQRFPRRGESPPVARAEGEDIAVLTRAFSRLLARLKPEPRLTITPREIRIEDKIEGLRQLLEERAVVEFEEAVSGATLGEIVVTFLALLELVRLGEVRVEQQEEFGPIRLMRREPENLTPVSEAE